MNSKTSTKYGLLAVFILLINYSFLGCSDKPNYGELLRFDSLPPNNNVKIFKNYDEAYEYFNDLSLKDKNAMIRRLKDSHPLVDSLRKLENEMIGNTFKDMLPERFESASESGDSIMREFNIDITKFGGDIEKNNVDISRLHNKLFNDKEPSEMLKTLKELSTYDDKRKINIQYAQRAFESTIKGLQSHPFKNQLKQAAAIGYLTSFRSNLDIQVREGNTCDSIQKYLDKSIYSKGEERNFNNKMAKRYFEEYKKYGAQLNSTSRQADSALQTYAAIK